MKPIFISGLCCFHHKQREAKMYNYLEVYESLVNGQGKQATRQLQESHLSLSDFVRSLRDSGLTDTQILNHIKKLDI